MNKFCYRVVFSRIRGQWIVVSDIARSEGKDRSPAQPGVQQTGLTQVREVLARLKPLALSVFLAQGLVLLSPAAQAEITVDKSASSSRQATLLRSANGTPQVDIQSPSASGLSHNKFTAFNIDADGVVLNNSRTATNTQLAGYVNANPWLARGEASVILNEVNGTASQLRGFMEVAGKKADVIVANPAGITCSGCGFINAGNATLTTGTPLVSNGNLTGYQVSGGTINIQGQGLNALGVDYSSLIARAVEINASLHAQDLTVITGINEVDTTTQQVTAGTGSDTTKPAFAIDVAQLGGMYAGKITLVGTEAGVGVRNAGEIGASAGNFTLTADGKLLNSGAISASHSLTADTRGVDNSGSLYSRQTLTLSSRGTVHNSGTIAALQETSVRVSGANNGIISTSTSALAAGVEDDGSFNTAVAAKLNLTASGTITAHGRVIAPEQLAIDATTIDLSGSYTEAGQVILTARDGVISTRNASVKADTRLTINASKELDNSAGFIATNSQSLQISTGTLKNASGQILHTSTGNATITTTSSMDNSAGTIATNGQNLNLTADQLTNTEGHITHAGTGTLAIGSTDLTGERGNIASNGALLLATGELDLDGASTQASNIAIAASQLSNVGGNLIQTGTGDTNLSIATSLNNELGLIASNGSILLTADNISNRGGTLQSSGNNSQLTLSVNGKIDNSAKDNLSGLIAATGNLSLDADSLDNNQSTISAGGNLQLTVEKTLTNQQGQLVAEQQLSLSSGSLDNQQGTVGSVQGDVSINIDGELNNAAGRIESSYNLDISSQGLDNSSGLVLGAKVEIDNQQQTLNNSQGQIIANGSDSSDSLTLNSGALNNDQGVIQSTAGDLLIDTYNQTLTNTNAGSDSGIISGGKLQISSSLLDNRSGYIGSADDLFLQGAQIDNRQQGIIFSQAQADLSGTGLNNQGGQIQSLDTININLGDGTLNNTGSLIHASEYLNISAAQVINSDTKNSDPDIANNKGLQGHSVSIDSDLIRNDNGTIIADQQLTLTSRHSIDNSSGLISSTGSVTLRDSDPITKTLQITNTAGTLTATSNLTIDSAGLSGDGELLSQGDIDITLTDSYSHSGKLEAAGSARLVTAGTLTNSSSFKAGQQLQLRAATLNNQAGAEIRATDLLLTATDSNTFTNRGLIDSLNTYIDSITLNNLGTGRIYGDHIALSATTLNNLAENGSAPVIAARQRLDLGVNTLNNTEHGLIFSAGDLFIGGDLDAQYHATGSAATLNNNSATIEALGNMTLNVERLFNTNEHISTTTVSLPTVEVEEFKLDSGDVYRPRDIVNHYQRDEVKIFKCEAQCMKILATGDTSDQYTHYEFTRSTTETAVASSDPGQLLAGGNLTLNADSVSNAQSQIIAGLNLNATVRNLENIGISGERITTDNGTATAYRRQRRGGHDTHRTEERTYAPVSASQNIAIQLAVYQEHSSTMGSGTELVDYNGSTFDHQTDGAGEVNQTQRSQNIRNQTLQTELPQGDNTSGPDTVHSTPGYAQLPNSSLYNTPNNNNNYLIETDPRFADYRSWLSSDYLLDKVKSDPATTQKRLGDGFYEQRLLQQQITQLTGQRYLPGYNNDEEQYKALMIAGVSFATEYNLKPGIALSAEQIGRLTSDIVWLVEREVILADGTTTSVLAPQIYALPQDGDLAISGALMGGKKVNIDSQQLHNEGTILGEQAVAITTDTLDNIGGQIAANEVDIDATQDINNRGGLIQADSRLAMNAGRDINIASITREASNKVDGNQFERVTIAGLGRVNVRNPDGQLYTAAGRDINLRAAQINNTGDNSNTTMIAGNDINVGTVETRGRDALVWDSRNYQTETWSEEIGSQITTGGSLQLLAQNDLRIRGAQVEAGETATLKAGNDLTLEDARKTDSHRSNFSNSKAKTNSDQTVGTNLDATNILLQSGGNTTLTAAQISAKQDLAINATGDVAIRSATDSDYNYQFSNHKGSFGSKKTRTTETYRTENIGSDLTAGDNLSLNSELQQSADGSRSIKRNASGKVLIESSSLSAGDQLAINADDGLEITSKTEVDYRREEHTKSRFFGLSNSASADSTRLEQLSDAQVETRNDDLSLLSADNVTVIAGDIRAGGDINIDAQGDVLISAGTESTETHHMDASSSFLSGGNFYEMEENTLAQRSTTAKAATLSAGNDVNIDASRATVIGSDISAGQDINATTDVGDIQVLAAQETANEESSHKSVTVSFGDIVEAISKPHELIKEEDGKLKATLAEASYDEVDTTGSDVSHRGSTLTAGNDLNLDSAGDVQIEGAQLAADADLSGQGDINIDASGDVLIKEAETLLATTRDETHASAELSFIVEHKAVEVPKAIIALDKARKNLKQAQEDYRQYQKDVQRIEREVAQMEQDYLDKTAGINAEDIYDMHALQDDLKGDENWYKAGIATAIVDVTSKSTLLAQQIAAAASSVSTWGFDAGVQLDIEGSKTETQAQSSQSQASSLSGQNIHILTGTGTDKSDTRTRIQGSHLAASDNITIDTGELDIEASQDTSSNSRDSESVSLSMTSTLHGAAAGGVGISGSYNRSNNQDKSTTYNNSTLSADNIVTHSTGDTRISGANISGDTSVEINSGGNLLVEAKQDRHSGSNKSSGISAGFSTSPGSANSVNGGISTGAGRYLEKDVVESGITARKVDINVEQHTQLNGATIAAIDSEGNDTGQLKLDTETFAFTDLSNISQNNQRNAGVNVSVTVGDDKAEATETADKKEDPGPVKTSSLQYSNNSSFTKTKTLATLGQGEVTIRQDETDGTDSTERLNRDVTNTEKAIVSLDWQEGNIDATLDHRLLSAKGHEEIKQQLKELPENMGKVAGATIQLLDNTAELITNIFPDNLTEKQREALYAATLAGDKEKLQAAWEEIYKRPLTPESEALIDEFLAKNITIAELYAQLKPEERELVFSGRGVGLDGTGNNADVDRQTDSLTNVAIMIDSYRAENGKESAKYIPGVGTKVDFGFIDQFVCGFSGCGGERQIQNAIKFLAKAWDGKSVMAIDATGFSRGSGNTRTLINRILNEGIPGIPSEMIFVRSAFLFDTVGSNGLPGNDIDIGHDFSTSNQIGYVTHYTAENEYRNLFDLQSVARKDGTLPDNTEEISYPGAHTDIGSGYKPGEGGKSNELSNIVLRDAYAKAQELGVFLGKVPDKYAVSPELDALYNAYQQAQADYQQQSTGANKAAFDKAYNNLAKDYIHDSRYFWERWLSDTKRDTFYPNQ